MRKFKFKVGDIVRCISKHPDDKSCKGKIGKLISIDNDDLPYVVEFFEPVQDGHGGGNDENGEGRGKWGYCRWFVDDEEEIELYASILKLFLKEKQNEL